MHVAAIASHPTQYQTPLWRALVAIGVDLEVLYLSRQGHATRVDPEFGVSFAWDTELLSGYCSQFAPELRDFPAGSPWTGVTVSSRQFLRTGTFDALILPGYAMAGYVRAILAARSVNLPIYLRGETVSNAFRARLGSSRGRFRRRLHRQVVSRVSGAFPLGRESERFYLDLGLGPDRLTMARYGIDNAAFNRASPSAICDARHRLGVRDSDRVLLFAGKFIARKRPLDVLATAARLRQRGFRVRSMFVGTGPLEPRVRSLMTEDDMALGFVNQGDLPLLYSAADVVLVPSLSETWGLVVNEALAAGTPVVASTGVTGALEIMAASNSGRQTIRVAQSHDLEGLADGAETLLRCDREDLALQAAAAVAPFDVTLAAEAIAERLERDGILYGRAKQ